MTPEELGRLTNGIEETASDISAQLTQKIAESVVHRFEKNGKIVISSSDDFRIKTLRRSGQVYSDIMENIGKKIGDLNAGAKDAFYESVGLLPKPEKVKVNKAVQQMVEGNPPKVGVQTSGKQKIENLTGTTVRRVKRQYSDLNAMSDEEKEILDKAYRKTRNEFYNLSPKTARGGQRMYIEACNEAYNNAMAGMSPQKAVAEALKHLSAKGMYVEYDSGHRDTIEVAVARAVRTAVNQAHAKIILQRAEDEGQDLLLVSSHQGARPSHQPWQGKIYSISGKSKKYPSFYEKTGYGTINGLCGINCRHTFVIYYPGSSRNNNRRYSPGQNRKAYELQQKQREYERAIRKEKRQRNIFEEIVKTTRDENLRKEANEQAAMHRRNLRSLNKEYTDFCKKHNLKRKTNRTRVAEL